MKNTEKIKVVICEPFIEAKEIEVDSDYVSLSNLIGKYVSTFDLITNKVVIVYDDEGKLNGSQFNRAIFQEDKLTDFKTKKKHQLIDLIYNSFIICGTDGENLISLTDEQIEQYKNLYKYSEILNMNDEKIMVTKIKDYSIEIFTVDLRKMECI